MGKVESVYSHELLRQAERFKIAVEVLWKSQVSELAIPAETNACLACELYLKYILNFHDKKSVRYSEIQQLHELDALFCKLPDTYSNNISEEMNMSKEDVLMKLSKVRANFVALRYEYEYERMTFSFGFLNNLMQVLDKQSHEIENDRK